MLGVGEPVELDAVVGVGDAEALEGGEDVAAGWFGGAAFGEQLALASEPHTAERLIKRLADPGGGRGSV